MGRLRRVLVVGLFALPAACAAIVGIPDVWNVEDGGASEAGDLDLGGRDLGADRVISSNDAAADALGEAACEEIDSGSDPANCGTCGHNCLGGACEAGVCQPVEIASGQVGPRSVVVDLQASGHVYWATYEAAGAIMVANKDGSNAKPLVPSQPFAQSLSYDGTWLVWTTGNTQGTYSINLSDTTGNARQIAVAQTSASFVGTAVSSGVAYWSAYSSGAVDSLPVSSPACTGASCPALVGSQSPAPGPVVVNDAGLYWLGALLTPGDAGYLGYAATSALDGGNVRLLASGQGDLVALAAAAGSLYWTDSVGGSVFSAPLDGGPLTPIAGSQHHPFGIVADATRIYWTNLVGDGAVMSANFDGTDLRALATNVLDAWGIAVDDVAVYWVTQEGAGPDGGVSESYAGVWKVAK